MLLQKFKKFRECESRLFEDVCERALGNFRVRGNHRPPSLVADSFFKRNVTALLTKLHESSRFQSLDDALAGYARQFGHVRWKLRRSSRTPELRLTGHQERPSFPNRVRWLRASWRARIPRLSLAKSHQARDTARHTNRLLIIMAENAVPALRQTRRTKAPDPNPP
jgi:hypothetical protein